MIYRVIAPLISMRKNGFGSFFLDEQWMRPHEVNDREKNWIMAHFENYEHAKVESLKYANVHLYHHLGGKSRKRFIELVREENPNYQPLFIIDYDDNLEYCDPHNDAFIYLGCRRPDGTPLEPGDTIFVPDPEGGDPLPLWEDGKVYQKGRFSIRENLERSEDLKEFSRTCDAITVTGEGLRRYYTEEVGCKNVYVRPNAMPLETFPDLVPEYPKEQVRILWQGGSSHYPDLYGIRGILADVIKSYPHVKFVSYGHLFKYLVSHIPADKLETYDWGPFKAHYHMLSMIGPDINLCPLADNEFNRCKSSIKFMEASAIKRPAATLAANVGPYAEDIADGKTGLLYEGPADFKEKLCRLIEDAWLRKELASNASEWVRRERDLHKVVAEWCLWLHEMRSSKLILA